MNKYKIINVKFAQYGHWATDEENNKKYEIRSKGKIQLYLTLVDKNFNKVEVPVDLFYGTGEEGERLVHYFKPVHKSLKILLPRLKFKYLGMEVYEDEIYRISQGTGYRLVPELTKQIRLELLGEEEVVLTNKYYYLLKKKNEKKLLSQGKRVALWEELKNNPHLPLREIIGRLWENTL